MQQFIAEKRCTEILNREWRNGRITLHLSVLKDVSTYI
jgi:hypothetical protein